MFEAGKRITELREQHGLTITALAKMADIAQSSLSYIEAGKTSPQLDTIYKICNALDMTLVDFFNLKDQDLESLPPAIWKLVSKKENHGMLKLVQAMKDKGYSNEVISEWINSLDNTLTNMRARHALDTAVWANEDDLPESARGKYTEEEKQAALDKYEQKKKTSKPPWEK